MMRSVTRDRCWPDGQQWCDPRSLSEQSIGRAFASVLWSNPYQILACAVRTQKTVVFV